MRLVLDTNVVVSGLLWQGPPLILLQYATDSKLQLVSSAPLIAEFATVLNRKKLSQRISEFQTTPHDLLIDYVALVEMAATIQLGVQRAPDPDDDIVLACALAGRADWIVSGDRRLVAITPFEGIEIVTPVEAVRRLKD